MKKEERRHRKWILHLIVTTLLSCSSPCKADICGYHATLVEQDRFYIAQPFQTEILMDLDSYYEFFEQLNDLLPKFKSNFDTYTTDSKMDKVDPFPKRPFDGKRNVIKLKDKMFPSNASKGCAEAGGELIYATPSTFKALGKAIQSFELTHAPLAAIPFHSSIYSPDLKYIGTPGDSSVIEMLSKDQLPVLTFEGNVAYPVTTPSSSTTTSPLSGSSKYDILCFKENNPWDLPTNRKKWYHKIFKIASSIRLLEKISSSFDSVKNVIKSLKKQPLDTIKKISLQAPAFMQKAAEFLKEFSDTTIWEKTTPSDEIRFDDFITNSRKIESYFDNSQSVLKIRNAKQSFELPFYNNENWLARNDFNSYHLGMMEPILVSPLGSVEGKPESSILAKVQFRLFDRNDLVTIFAIQPNIINGMMTSAQFFVSSHSSKIITMTPPVLIDCTIQPGETIKACKSISIPSTVVDVSMIECARALVNKEADSGFQKCPLATAPQKPLAYFAQCNSSNLQKTAIISSPHSAKISVLCNNNELLNKEFNQFPVQIVTDCEVRDVTNGRNEILLQQFQKELQLPEVGSIVSPPSVAISDQSNNLNGLHFLVLPSIIVTGTSLFFILILVIVIAILDPKRFSCNSCCGCCPRTTPDANNSLAVNYNQDSPFDSRIFIPQRGSRPPSRANSVAPSGRSFVEGPIQTF